MEERGRVRRAAGIEVAHGMVPLAWTEAPSARDPAAPGGRRVRGEALESTRSVVRVPGFLVLAEVRAMAEQDRKASRRVVHDERPAADEIRGGVVNVQPTAQPPIESPRRPWGGQLFLPGMLPHDG